MSERTGERPGERAERPAELLARGVAVTSEPVMLVDGRLDILAASTGAGALLGLPREQLIGRNMREFLSPAPSLPRIERLQEHRNGRPLDLELRGADDRRVPVEAHCDVFTTEDGSQYCLLVVHDRERVAQMDAERTARLAKLGLINQVSEALHSAQLTLDEILEAVLICVTAGQGLRFNRAFLLLVDEQRNSLRGEIAIGPSNREEAARIWSTLAGQNVDLYQMITRYSRTLRQTDVVVNEVVRRMVVPLSERDDILIRAMQERRPYRLRGGPGDPGGAELLRAWLGCDAFAVAPLSTRRGSVGVIVADNAITGTEIGDLDLEFLQLFANQSANAIENSRLYHELERRLIELRKAAQRQKDDQELLLRMERLSVMGETSAIVAHELRNPLVAIGGFARTLSRNLPEDDPNQRFAAIITEEVGRLERIIHDLLDFVRPQKLLRKAVVGDELVGETVRRYEGRLAEQDIALELELGAPDAVVHVNPNEIQQVLQNMVVNAAQAMGREGRLVVRTSLVAGGFQAELLDTGPGIDPDVRDRIFSPFFTTKPSGSGLGLTICAQIVKTHGGKLLAENRPEGGARFGFVLPLPREEAGREDEAADVVPDGQGAPGALPEGGVPGLPWT